MEILFIRHGESTANQGGIIQGQGDYPLSQRGKEQARLTARALENTPASCIYASPLKRAKETAKIINGPHGSVLIELDELMEYDLGEFEGLTMAEIIDRRPDAPERMKSGVPFHHLPENAETDEEVGKRAIDALSTVTGCGRERVFVVSHLGVLALMVHVLLKKLGIDNPHGKNLILKNCSITCVRTTPLPELVCLNDDSHLSGLLKGVNI